MRQRPNGPTWNWAGIVGFGLATAAVIAVYANLAHWLLLPLHARGYGQSSIAYLNALDHLLQAPGYQVVSRLGHQSPYHHMVWRRWLFSVGINALVDFVIGCALRLVWLRTRTSKVAADASFVPTGESLTSSERSRRHFLRTGLRLVGGGAAAGLVYGLAVEPHWFRITRRRISIRDLPSSLNGLRIVQLTDIHHGPWLALGYVRQVVDAANALAPDLICLTGDYVHKSPAYIEPVIGELARLHAKIGTVAVLGNHDWWEDGPLVRQELIRAGIAVIDNARRILTPDGKLAADAAEGLAITGVGDLWEGQPDYQAALAGLPQTMPRLLLAHNPDCAEARALIHSGLRVDLMLSGHTHGGQVAIPFLGSPGIPSAYGEKYARGLVEGPVCPVFVCRGIGMTVLPLRFGAFPEIAVLELRAGIEY